MLNKFFIYFCLLATTLITPSAKAADPVSLSNPINGLDNILEGSAYLGQVIGRVLGIIGAVALLLLVYGGISMIISGGNESKITKSKSIIVYTLIGLVIIFSSYLIINFTINSIRGTASVEETQDLPTAPGG